MICIASGGAEEHIFCPPAANQASLLQPQRRGGRLPPYQFTQQLLCIEADFNWFSFLSYQHSDATTRMNKRLFKRMRFLVGALIVCVSWTLAMQAELVILRSGDVLKVKDFRVMGNDVRLSLPSGGSITLPLLRVERIIDDEISSEPELIPEPEPPPLVRYEPSHQVPATPYGELIHATALRHGLNPNLVAAMVRHESGFDPQALSPRGARGLLQVMPATAERFGISQNDLLDPELNLEAGARYLSWLVNHFDSDLARVLAAFNAGEGTVARYNGVPPYRETREYVRRIYFELGIEQDDT